MSKKLGRLNVNRGTATASTWLLHYGLVKTREEGIKYVNRDRVRINDIIARPVVGYCNVKKEDIKILS